MDYVWSLCQCFHVNTSSTPQFRRVYFNNPEKNKSFPNNKISNTKYNVFTFIPKNLYFQFSQFMNIYFLIIAFIQLVDILAPVTPLTIWIPLIFIFSLSAIKEAADDISRWRVDKKANERLYVALHPAGMVQKYSQQILVGDLLYIQENEEIPCDILILKTSEKNGSSYIQTANLDGEIDLKPRQAVPKTAELKKSQLCTLQGVVECSLPNPQIYNFDSRVIFEDDEEPFSLNEKNFGLQTTYLKNTKWICGLVVYTGGDTKFGQNKRAPPSKITKIDLLINKMIVAIFITQLLLIIFLGVSGNMVRSDDSLWYLSFDVVPHEWYWWAIIPLRFLLLMSLIIPISLKVSIDVVKFAYAAFISWDLEMYDDKTNTPPVASSTSISEDLAQVEYIFTDKTGTLTENIMEVKYCTISKHSYSISDEDLVEKLKQNQKKHHFMMALALCHTVVPEVDEVDESVQWKASSPDEEAIVKAAAKIGFVFCHQTQEYMELSIFGNIEKFRPLHVLQFTSERKRMGILIKNKKNQIFLFLKGADEVILARVSDNKHNLEMVQQQVEAYSKQGLRTMVIAKREVTEEEYESWQEEVNQASNVLENRTEALSQLYEKMEKDLHILGVVAIEDKLQDLVPETIQNLREAGIRIWMLTGDKFSTAKQIAISCNLISSDSPDALLRIEASNNKSALECVQDYLDKFRSQREINSLIIEGNHLSEVLKEDANLFCELAILAKTVICCRVTPKQKSEVVRLIKKQGKITLAIGDGGNDVSMIQEASLGIGIAGREGLQAARAADYSFAKFKFLQRLLFVHGHYSYHRTAFVGHYCFHKSIFIALIQILFAFYSSFSGSSFFNAFALATYNTLFTGLPVMLYCLDRDKDQELLMNEPKLYEETQKGSYMNIWTILYWIMRTCLQSALVFGLTKLIYGENLFPNGEPFAYASLDLVVYTIIVSVQTLTIILESNSITIINFIVILLTFMSYFGIMSIATTVEAIDFFNVMFHLYHNPTFWFGVIIITMVTMLPVYMIKFFQHSMYPRIDKNNHLPETEPLILLA